MTTNVCAFIDRLLIYMHWFGSLFVINKVMLEQINTISHCKIWVYLFIYEIPFTQTA